MEELNNQPTVQPGNTRPQLLTILCILTFIGSGWLLFSNLMITLFYDIFMSMAHQFAIQFKMPVMDQMAELKPVFFLVSALLYAGSLTGAIMMMRLKKSGFHVYTIAQILLIIAPMYYMHLKVPGTFEILFSGLFIFLYSLNLKYMR